MSKRIVSLSAAATELLGEMGISAAMVGRSHECDLPAAVKSLPVCTEPRSARYGLRLAQLTDARSIVRDALSHLRVIPETLQQLKPEVIVTESLGKEYGLTLEKLQEAASSFTGVRTEIVSLAASSLENIKSSIEEFGKKLGSSKGNEVGNKFQQQLEKAKSHINKAATKPTVLCIQWLNPLCAAGYWIPSMVELAGGTNLFGKAGEAPKMIQWQDIIAANPDKVILMIAGDSLDNSNEDLALLSRTPEFRTLKAFKSKEIYVVEANHHFTRPTPTLGESLTVLAELIHMPKPSLRKHFGTLWSEFF